MPRDFSSTRIERLMKIVNLLRKERAVKRETFLQNGQCVRTMERDLAYLRNKFNMEIVYDSGAKAYILTNTGDFP